MTRITDRFAIDGKIQAPDETHDVVIVGGGAAGLAAAIAAAEAGRQVVLIDEHPVAASAIGSDVPLWFGGRATPAVQAGERLIEGLVEAEPMIAAAFEAGVDVRLGTVAWGLWRNRENLAALPQAMLGLSDGTRAWTMGFAHLILATGSRDCALHFAGWDQPGVMGALAFDTLVRRYRAFAGSRVVVVGSGALAAETARLAESNGIAVAAMIEVRDRAQADCAGIAAPLLAGHRLVRATGGIDGVEALVVADAAGGETVLACDTVVMAIDAVPAIELAEVAGAPVVTDPLRGGAVTPGGAGEVLPHIWLAGAATGQVSTHDDAAAQGRAVVAAMVGEADTIPVGALEFDRMAYRAEWLRALVASCGDATLVCQCEEVSRADLTGVQPPRYLARGERMACRSLGSLLADGPPDAEQVKRLTRAGMGLCQGRRCREQISLLLAGEANLSPAAAPRGNWRVPVRPVPLGVIADWSEAGAMADGWDVWFGIPTQWIPYHTIGTEEETRLMTQMGGNMHL